VTPPPSTATYAEKGLGRARAWFNRAEAGGALGDLGTFIPLLAGMVNRCGLQLGPALFFAGLMNLITGFTFGIPMPVQPMKAIATVAIAQGLSQAQILAAGTLTGAVVLVLALTHLLERLNRAIPRSVIRGLQLALGLKLIQLGFERVASTHALFGWDSIALGIGCAVLVLLLYFSTRVPGALVVFGVGCLALLMSRPAVFSAMHLGIDWHLPPLADWEAWRTGFWQGTIPQVPLTLLNSVIAVCALSADLFPHRPAAPRRVALSVALMNIISCPFGAMPMCHGSGGLAGQYRFGARTGGSVVMLGAAKMALALLFGGSLLAALQAYPQSVLGILLLFSGLELALVCRDQTKRVDFFVVALTCGACLALNMAVGVLVGWAMAAALIWGVFRIEPTPDSREAQVSPAPRDGHNPPAC
jgi:MFS superfamily sulfate permease-like transporter